MFNTELCCNMRYIHNCKLTPRIDVPGVGTGKLRSFLPSFSGATDSIRSEIAKLSAFHLFAFHEKEKRNKLIGWN